MLRLVLHGAQQVIGPKGDGVQHGTQPGHVAGLDGLRAFAVGLVLWIHLPYIADSWLSKAIWDAAHGVRAGFIGVDIFFALSGYLITRLLIQERDATGGISLTAFYIRRSLRIFPIYFLCIFLAQFIDNSPGGLLSALTYTSNFYHPFHPAPHPLEHTWSLCVEEHFYLIWPFVMTVLPLRLGLKVTGIIVPALSLLAAAAFAMTFEGPLAGELIYMSTPTRIISLSLGASLAFEERTGHIRSLPWALWMLLAGLGVIALALLARAGGVLPAGGPYWCFALVGYGLISRSIVTLTVFERRAWFTPVRAFLETAPMRYIGRISYGLYLYHYLVLFALGVPEYRVGETGTSAINVVAALVLSFAVAALSFRYIETPLLNLKHRLAPRPAPAPSSPG